MVMPKAPVHEDRPALRNVREVRRAGQTLNILPVVYAERFQGLCDGELRLGRELLLSG